jgi:hypothetical protein
MGVNVWQRLRRAARRSKERRDEIAIERALLEHEQEARQNATPEAGIPPLRNNTDWSQWAGPS